MVTMLGNAILAATPPSALRAIAPTIVTNVERQGTRPPNAAPTTVAATADTTGRPEEEGRSKVRTKGKETELTINHGSTL